MSFLHINPTELATPAFIFLVVVEMFAVYATGRGAFESRDTLASLLMGFFSVVMGTVYTLFFFGFGAFLYRYRIADIAVTPLSFAVASRSKARYSAGVSAESRLTRLAAG